MHNDDWIHIFSVKIIRVISIIGNFCYVQKEPDFLKIWYIYFEDMYARVQIKRQVPYCILFPLALLYYG